VSEGDVSVDPRPKRSKLPGVLVQVRRAKVRCSNRCESCPGKGRPGRVAIPAAAEVTKRPEPGRKEAAKAVCKLAGRNMREHRDGPERHDAKADPAWTGGRLARVGRARTTDSTCFAGVVGDGMSTRSNGQHGRPASGGQLSAPAHSRLGRLATAGVGGVHSTIEAG
jgi:hypothetical protein